jgi:hypothetical protein
VVPLGARDAGIDPRISAFMHHVDFAREDIDITVHHTLLHMDHRQNWS